MSDYIHLDGQVASSSGFHPSTQWHDKRVRVSRDALLKLGYAKEDVSMKAEYEYILEMPEGLRLLADHHDCQATMGDAMGYGVSGNELKAKEYREKADAIDKENAS